MSLAVVFAFLTALLVAPSAGAASARVTINAATSAITAGDRVKISGKVNSKFPRGTAVSVQQRKPGTWVKVAATKVSSAKRYSVHLTPPEGEIAYRVVVARTKKRARAYSRILTITVGARSAAESTSPSPSPSPSESSDPSSSEVVARILADTNAFRATNGLAPLKLNSAINRVAAAWAKKMYDSGSFKHNPNYSNQIPDGWTRCGENIAAGQEYDAVVQAWIDSPGHRANLLGDYTDIGIGYYSGANGYGTYYVQNLARY